MTTEIREQIHRRTDRGTWRAKVLLPGATSWLQKDGFQTKTAAKQWAEEQKAAYFGGRLASPEAKKTFHGYLQEHYLPALPDPAKQEDQERLARLYLLPSVPRTLTFEEMDRPWVRNWFGKVWPALVQPNGKPISASYRNKIFWLFKEVLDQAVEDEILLRTPLPRDLRPKPEQPSKVDKLEPFEVDQLAETIREVVLAHTRGKPDPELWAELNHVLVYALAYGGFRIGEGLSLRVDDLVVNQNGTGLMAVDEQVNQDGKFSNNLKRKRSHRTVPLGVETVALIEGFIDRMGRSGSDLIFGFPPEGKPMRAGNWRRRYFQPAAAVVLPRLPQPVRPHLLRHTAASAWFAEGYDMDDVASFLGDSVTVARDTYVHMYQEYRMRGIERMDERLRRGRAEAQAQAEISDLSERRRKEA